MALGQDSIGDPCKATANALSKAFSTGELSPVNVVEEALARAHATNDELNAFTFIDDEGAISAAKESERRWIAGNPFSPADGIPTTLKDIVHCGWDVSYGSFVTKDVSDKPDAPSIKLMRSAGAIMIGLTNTPEFGWKAVTDNLKFGVTRNPWDASKTPGGSSGGAAAAAAVGAGTFHLGTDGGGSIRIPASFTGIVGFKPSFGRVPTYPASAFGTVAHIGPMARSVGDIALMLNTMSGRDLRDWHQAYTPVHAVDPKTINLKGLKIGYWNEPGIGSNNPEVAELINRTVRDIELSGAIVEPIAIPFHDELLEVFYRHWHVGAATRLSSIPKSDHGKLDPGFLEVAEKGSRYSAIDRMQAEIARSDFGAAMDQLLEQYAFLISPTVPIPAFEAGVNVPQGSNYNDWVEWSAYSYPINLSQQPACSLPCGKTSAGLPVGLQIVGARGRDEDVLDAALTYEFMYPDRFLLPGEIWPAYANGDR